MRLIDNPVAILGLVLCLWPLMVGAGMSAITWAIARGWRVRIDRGL